MSLPGFYSKILKNTLLKKSNLGYLGKNPVRYSKIWEPDYLSLARTKTPEYDLINVQMKAYDFAVLENYQRLVNSIANTMNLKINDSWAAPQQNFLVQHFKPNSSEVKHEYNLKLSERNIQVIDVKSHVMALFIDTIVTCCPPGVFLSVHEHESEMEEYRYVPEYDILDLKEDLEHVGDDKYKVKKKLYVRPKK